MFNNTKKGKYSDLRMEYKMLQKIMTEDLLPKGGGVYQPSLDHKVLLHFLITKDKANVPKYIFNHMMWALKESQNSKRSWIPYGRLLSEIFHQGGIMKALKLSKVINDDQLGTVTGKIINASALRNMNMIKKEEFTKLKTYLQESFTISNLMDNFTPIFKQDHLDVQIYYIHEHLKTTGESIRLEDIPEKMYSGTLLVARKRKSKKKATSEAGNVEEAPEPQRKKAKKNKQAPQEQATGSGVPSIQDEVRDLEPAKILNKRTRSGKTVATSQPLPPQPSIPKKKRKHVVRKMKVSSYGMEEEEEVEAATELVSREFTKKKAVDAADLEKALAIAKEIEVPAEVLLKESSVETAHQVIELIENLQQLVVAGANLNDAKEPQKQKATCSEALRGNIDSRNISNIIEIGSSTTSASLSTFISTTSTDMDNIPLDRVYANLQKRLSP